MDDRIKELASAFCDDEISNEELAAFFLNADDELIEAFLEHYDKYQQLGNAVRVQEDVSVQAKVMAMVHVESKSLDFEESVNETTLYSSNKSEG